LGRSINKIFNSSVSSLGAINRFIQRAVQGTIVSAGNLSTFKIVFNPAKLKEIIVSIIDFVIDTFVISNRSTVVEDMSIETSVVENNVSRMEDMTISTEIVDNMTGQVLQERDL